MQFSCGRNGKPNVPGPAFSAREECNAFGQLLGLLPVRGDPIPLSLPVGIDIGTVSPLGRHGSTCQSTRLTSVGLSWYSVPPQNTQALFPNLTRNMANKVRERMDDKTQGRVGGNQKIWLMQQKAPQSMAHGPSSPPPASTIPLSSSWSAFGFVRLFCLAHPAVHGQSITLALQH